MARKPSVWFRKANKQYYTTINGVQHKLGPDKIEAERKFHALMAAPPEPEPESVEEATDDSVAALLDDFLDWTLENRAKRTYDGYKDFCEAFCKCFPSLNVEEVTTAHITRWLVQKPTWNSTTKRNAVTALQRAFNWAAKNRGLSRNPIAGMEKPVANTRSATVSDADFRKLLGVVKDTNFRDLLIVSYDTGARPQEVKRLEARHLDLRRRRAVLPTEEAKGKRKPRVFYFPTERSLKIVKRLAKLHTTGNMFRNTRGNAWTGYAVKCRFAKLEKKTGIRIRHYDLRHTFITNKLLAGVDSHVVATLAGHSDSSMIDKVYSHVADDHQFMLAAAKTKAKG